MSQSAEVPIFHDVSLLAAELERRGARQDLQRALRAQAALAAVHKDLILAQRMLRRLKPMIDLPSEQRDEDWLLHAEGLFTAAIVAYCRALHTDPIDRSRQGLREVDRAPLKARHRRVTLWRDKILAHYGDGKEHFGFRSVRDLALLMNEGDAWQWVYPSDRGFMNVQIVADLEALVAATVTAAEAKLHEQARMLLPSLFEAMATDDDVFVSWKASVFDPEVELAQNPHLVAQLLSGSREPGKIVSAILTRSTSSITPDD